MPNLKRTLVFLTITAIISLLRDWGLRGYPDIQLQTAYDLLTE